MMRPGKLDQRITLQAPIRTPDGIGGQSTTWTDFASVPNVWANVMSGAGGERFEEDRTTAQAIYVFTIRNREDVNEDDRIVWRGATYNIRNVKRLGGRVMYLKIEAERGV